MYFNNVSAKFLPQLVLMLCAIHLCQVVSEQVQFKRRFSESYYGTYRERSRCGINAFKCNSGQCVNEEHLCDGKEDCQDGSDETRECFNIIPCGSKFLFQCDYGACINKTMACDGKRDCKDNSDEAEKACSVHCEKGNFQCNSGQCIDSGLICDGVPDCYDYSDETRQVCSTMNCPPYTYQCRYGACARRNARCNGEVECADGSDEENCDSSTIPPPAGSRPNQGSVCGRKKYRCHSGQCINMDKLCDGKVDCADSSDEIGAVCKHLVCPPYAFRCHYGGCVSGRSLCNGVRDCMDNSDERYCTTYENSGSNTESAQTQQPESALNSESNGDGCRFPDHPANGKHAVGGSTKTYSPGDFVPPYSVLLTNCFEGYKSSPPEENPSICLNAVWSPAPAACSRTCPLITTSVATTIECRFNNKPLKSCENAVDGAVAILACQPFTFDTLDIDMRKATPSGIVQSMVNVCRDGRWDSPATQCLSTQPGSNNTVINVFYIFNDRSSSKTRT